MAKRSGVALGSPAPKGDPDRDPSAEGRAGLYLAGSAKGVPLLSMDSMAAAAGKEGLAWHQAVVMAAPRQQRLEAAHADPGSGAAPAGGPRSPELPQQEPAMRVL